MVQTIDSLEESGLAERRPHPTYRRKRAIYLTKDGDKLLTKARRTAGQHAQKVFVALTDDERAELHRLLRKTAGFTEDA